jgi:hypothetical protein
MSFHLYPPIVVSTSLPAGISTEAKQDAIILAIQSVGALTPVDFIDAPTGPLIDLSVNAIPSGGFLELIASTAADIKRIQVVDDIGAFMAIYVGAASSEVLLFGLGLGGSLVDVNIPAGSRVSIASLSGANITSGNMFINFLG